MTKEPTLSDLLKWCADHVHRRFGENHVPYSALADAAARLEARVAELESEREWLQKQIDDLNWRREV